MGGNGKLTKYDIEEILYENGILTVYDKITGTMYVVSSSLERLDTLLEELTDYANSYKMSEEDVANFLLKHVPKVEQIADFKEDSKYEDAVSMWKTLSLGEFYVITKSIAEEFKESETYIMVCEDEKQLIIKYVKEQLKLPRYREVYTKIFICSLIVAVACLSLMIHQNTIRNVLVAIITVVSFITMLCISYKEEKAYEKYLDCLNNIERTYSCLLGDVPCY